MEYPKELIPVSLHFAPEVLGFDGLPLVVFFLTLCQGDDQFGESVLGNEEPDGYDGKALLLVGLLQMPEFLSVKEKPTIPYRLVLAPAAPVVEGDVHAPDKEFVPHEKAIGVLQGHLAGADGFDFRPHQLNARRVGFQELVIERGPAVLDLYGTLRFRHNRLQS